MDENKIEVAVADSRGILEKISFAIMFVASFLVPIFFVPASFISTQFGTSLLFASAVILTTLLMIIESFGSGSLRLPTTKKYILWIYALVPIVYILAGLENGFSRLTFLGYTFDISTVGFIVLSFVYMFFVSLLFGEKKRIFYSYFAFVVSALLLAVFLVLRIIFGAGFLSFGIFTSLTTTPIGNWNNVGIFFGIGAVLSLLTYEMLNVSRIMKVILSAALLLSLVFLAFVNFGTIWIILAVCSLLFILYGIWNRSKSGLGTIGWKQKFLSLPLYPCLVFIISVIFVIWGSTLSGYFATHFNLTNLDVRPSFGTTMGIAKNTLRNQPLLGSGPNTFITDWLSYKPTEIISTAFWNTDFNYGIGLLPTFLVTTGIFGILSWLIFFCFYIFLAVKALFTKMEDNFLKYLVTSSFFVSLYLWIMTWVYVPSAVILILTFFFTGLFLASICIAGIMPFSPHSFSYTPKAGFVSSFVLVALFVGVLALGFGLFKNSESLWYFQKSSYALNTSNDVTSAEGFMNKAIAAMPYDVYYRSLAEIEIAKINAIVSQDMTKVATSSIQKEITTALPLAVSAGLSARDADPSDYLNWIELGRVYETAVPLKITGAYQSASAAYDEALRRNPQNPGIYLLFAQLDVDQNNLDEAKQYAQAAISAKSDYLDAYYLLAQIEVDQKDLSSAIASVKSAATLDPNDPALLFQLGVLQFDNSNFADAIATLKQSLSLSPQYANAEYFLGLSDEASGDHQGAIAEFQTLQKTNPDNTQVTSILSNLMAGKSIFATAPATSQTASATKGTLPVQEKQQ